MEEWRSKKEVHLNPRDKVIYEIPEEAVKLTERILLQYGVGEQSNEGLLYWAGLKMDNLYKISCVISPKISASAFHLEISHECHVRVVEIIAENGLQHIGQIHSHPGDWVGHSYTDDEKAAFKVRGLLSIVVPNYSINGMLPLSTCGVHRFGKVGFFRLSRKYIDKHFRVVQNGECKFFDLRHGN